MARLALLLCIGLALPGCAGRDRSPVRFAGPHAPVSNSETMRTVAGQAGEPTPLLPEPGDIWADLRFLNRPTGSDQSAGPAAPGSGTAIAGRPALPSVTQGHARNLASAAPAMGPPVRSVQAMTAPAAAVAAPSVRTQQAADSAVGPEVITPGIQRPEPVAAAPGGAAAPMAGTPETAAAAAAHVMAGRHGYSVQLAAVASEPAARAAWRQLQHRVPALIAGKVPTVAPATLGNRDVWRLRTGGFASLTEARTFCSRLESDHQPCWVVPETS